MKYSNTLTVKDFSGGYNSVADPEHVESNQYVSPSRNLMLTEGGYLVSRNGFVRYFTDASDAVSWTTYEKCVGLHEVGTASSRSLVRVGFDLTSGETKVQSITGTYPALKSTINTAAAAIATVGTGDEYCQFAKFGENLYIAYPDATALYHTPSAPAAVTITGTSLTYSKPKGVEVWYDRVWSYLDESVNRGEYLFWTDTDGLATNVDTQSLKIGAHGPITGMARIHDKLLIFKRDAIYILSGGEDVDNLLRLDEVTTNIGCIADRSIVTIDNRVYFCSDSGIFMTDGVSVSLASKRVDSDYKKWLGDQSFSGSVVKTIHAVHNKKLSQIVFFLPDSTAAPLSDEAIALSFDYERNVWSAPFTGMMFDSSCTFVNSSGSNIGEEIVVLSQRKASISEDAVCVWNVGSIDTVTSSDSVLAPDIQFYTKPYDLGDPTSMKMVRQLHVHLGGVGDTGNPVFYVYGDYGDVTTALSTTTVLSKVTGGTRLFPAWVEATYRISGSSNRFRFRMTMNTTGKIFAIAGFTIGFEDRGYSE